ncbi:MAG: hypothetical protein ABL993_05650 [Vicinamibacterales bacterium]
MVRRAVIGVACVGLVVGMAAVAAAQQPAPNAQDQTQAQARYKIFLMEGVLERAVQNGAAVLSRQVRALSPDAMFLTGAAQVRGFRLDGYGVFFDVEVPGLRPTVAWTLRAMAGDNGESLAQLKAFVQRAASDPRDRAGLESAIRRLELQMPSARMAGADGTVSAQSVSGVVQTAPSREADSLLLTDPNAAYTREVKTALIDAMLENSGGLTIGADEWLTVAARDGEPGNRLVPGDAYDQTTAVLRVKGSDLAAYRAGRLTLEEARRAVQTGEN